MSEQNLVWSDGLKELELKMLQAHVGKLQAENVRLWNKLAERESRDWLLGCMPIQELKRLVVEERRAWKALEEYWAASYKSRKPSAVHLWEAHAAARLELVGALISAAYAAVEKL